MTLGEYLHFVATKIEKAGRDPVEVRRLLRLCGNTCLEKADELEKEGVNTEAGIET